MKCADGVDARLTDRCRGAGGLILRRFPEDRWSRFPCRLQRSKAPQLPPGCYGPFFSGLVDRLQPPYLGDPFPLISIVHGLSNSFHGEEKFFLIGSDLGRSI